MLLSELVMLCRARDVLDLRDDDMLAAIRGTSDALAQADRAAKALEGVR